MITMKNQKRKAAIAKYKQINRGKQAVIELLPTLSTSMIVKWLRAMGYIYSGHKWVKKYTPEKRWPTFELEAA